MPIKQKIALVTGGNRGIGLAVVEGLAAQGHKVLLAARSLEGGEAAAKAIDGDVIAVPFDVTEPESAAALKAHVLETCGRLDILINNAGIALEGGAIDLSVRDFDRVLAVNLRGAFLVSKYVVEYMIEEIENREDRSRLSERPYSIINMSSINDELAIPNYLAYVVSKGGLKQMTKAMALELAPYGIRVNAIGPGPTMQGGRQTAKHFAAQRANTVLKRGAGPQEIVEALRYFLSAKAVTGQLLCVDGGQHLAWKTPDVLGVE